MNSHTPGPWEVYLESESPLVFGILSVVSDPATGTDIFTRIVDAGSQSEQLDDDHCFGIKSEADANLIAAAPELLAALMRLEFAAQCRDNTSGDACRLLEVKAELAEAAKQARAAIAKANLALFNRRSA